MYVENILIFPKRMKKSWFDLLASEKIIDQNNDKEIVKNLINRLIYNLYKPDIREDNTTFVADKEKLEEYELQDDAINWGDLQCYAVEKADNKYIAFVEEGNPEASENLKNYIEKFMSAWGWNVNVIVEW